MGAYNSLGPTNTVLAIVTTNKHNHKYDIEFTDEILDPSKMHVAPTPRNQSTSLSSMYLASSLHPDATEVNGSQDSPLAMTAHEVDEIHKDELS